jgi:two-component system phosphate regulon response regulator OmpR
VEDYLTKPFDPRELLLRIANILKRNQPEIAPATLHFGPYQFDPATHRLRRDGEPVHLTTAEATLMAALVKEMGQAISREDLARALSDSQEQEEVSSRKVDVQIGRLRKKIEPDTNRPRYIQTVRGAGYRLMV